jgi:hypothetical protein
MVLFLFVYWIDLDSGLERVWKVLELPLFPDGYGGATDLGLSIISNDCNAN